MDKTINPLQRVAVGCLVVYLLSGFGSGCGGSVDSPPPSEPVEVVEAADASQPDPLNGAQESIGELTGGSVNAASDTYRVTGALMTVTSHASLTDSLSNGGQQ